MKKILKKIIKNFKETRYNKIISISLMTIGIISVKLGEVTGFIFMSILAIALFFEKENIIYKLEP